MKILIIQQKMIGDVLTSSILFEALREAFPRAELHYLIHEHTFPVVEKNPFIDTIIQFNPQQDETPTGFLSFLKRIRREKYDIVVDVYSKINSAMITAFSGAKKRISYHKSYTYFAYTSTFERKKVSESKAGLAIENRMLLLKEIISNPPTALKPKIYLSEKESVSAKSKLERAGIKTEAALIMIGILGSSLQKTYPLRYMAEILDFITSRTGAQLLFNYMPRQEEEAKALFQLCNPATQKYIFFDVTAKNLREFMAMTSHCHALIGNEGGAINMAKALKVSTFSIFSPWIEKGDWGIYEDGKQQVSVHLKDHKPHIFKNISKKELSKKSLQFYELLEPKLIFAALEKFLSRNIGSKSAEKN